MYLKRNRKMSGGVSYDYWTLVESVRTAGGPRQRVVANVWKINKDRLYQTLDRMLPFNDEVCRKLQERSSCRKDTRNGLERLSIFSCMM